MAAVISSAEYVAYQAMFCAQSIIEEVPDSSRQRAVEVAGAVMRRVRPDEYRMVC